VPVHEVEDIFADILDRAKLLDPANTREWFDKLKVARFDGGSLAVGCPDEATARFLRTNCRTSFTRAAQHITGHLVSVDFNVDTPRRTPAPTGDLLPGLRLHPDYTFENFVVGPSNRLAHASCVAVSQSLGNTYNPPRALEIRAPRCHDQATQAAFLPSNRSPQFQVLHDEQVDRNDRRQPARRSHLLG